MRLTKKRLSLVLSVERLGPGRFRIEAKADAGVVVIECEGERFFMESVRSNRDSDVSLDVRPGRAELDLREKRPDGARPE
jgi:hypothetical protein